jgi:hypothetical protein
MSRELKLKSIEFIIKHIPKLEHWEQVELNKNIDIIIQALKRNNPKKIIKYSSEHTGICPNCDFKEISITIWRNKITDEIQNIDVHDNYCKHCGQRLEGSDNNE